MFSYKIILSNGTVFDSTAAKESSEDNIKTISAANYYCHCVHKIIDLLNGGREYNQSRILKGKAPLDSNHNTQRAFISFLIALYEHREFSKDEEILKILSLDPLSISLDTTKKSRPNYAQYEELYRIYELHKDKPENPEIPTRLAHVLVDFEIPGIQEIQISMLSSSQHGRLMHISFPAELIPEKFRHQLSLAAGDPAEDKEIKAKIVLFADKAEALYNLDDPTASSKPRLYKKFLAFLLDDNPVKMLEAIVQLTALEATETTNAGAGASTSASAALFGTAKDAHKAVIKNHLFRKYRIPKDESPATLEKLLRCAAANANVTNVQVLLELLKVNPNAQDANPSSKKSALHWAVIRAQDHEKKSELVGRYRKCIIVLKRSWADLELTDADGKTARDYDLKNLFPRNLSAAPGTTASASRI